MIWAVPASAPTLIVSDTGRVIRMASTRRNRRGWQTFPEKELAPRKIGAGYLAVNSKDQGVKRTLYIHRLVAEAFLGRPSECNEVNHLDGNKSNNCLENLEWTTHSRNLQHAFQTDLHPGKSLQAAQVKSIRASLDAGSSASAIATAHGVSVSAIRHIQSRRTWAWLD
jgi:hypothetical protein